VWWLGAYPFQVGHPMSETENSPEPVQRWTAYYQPVKNDIPPRIHEVLAARIRNTIDGFPAAGIRGV